MSDLTSITGLITAAGSVIGLANKVNSVEANQKILELQKRLADVQQTFAELLEENQALKDDKRRLQDEIGTESMYPFRESVRWKKGADGDDGPFCPVCFANKKILMPLKLNRRMTTPGLLMFFCPEPHAPLPGMNRGMTFEVEEASIKAGRYKYSE